LSIPGEWVLVHQNAGEIKPWEKKSQRVKSGLEEGEKGKKSWLPHHQESGSLRRHRGLAGKKKRRKGA